MNKKVARLPENKPADEWCDFCGDDNIVLVIQGQFQQPDLMSKNVVLCMKCFYQMQRDIKGCGL